jgi:hypothetical protein
MKLSRYESRRRRGQALGAIASLVGQIFASGLAGLAYALVLESLKRRRKGESPRARLLIDPTGCKLIVFRLLLVWLGFEFFLAPTLITQYRGVPIAISPYLTSLGLLVEFAACAFGILFFYGTPHPSPRLGDQ